MDVWDLDENPLSKWQTLEHCKSIMPKLFYNEWQLMLGLHFVLVILHGQFTNSIQQNK